MGVIKQGILGGFSGKIANVVGSSWKGIAVIKSRPLSVANPQSAGQTAQRTKFSAAVAMAKALLTVIVKPLWDRFAQLQSGYNAFIQANIDNFSEAGALTYADFIISQGSLLGDGIDEINASNGALTFTLGTQNSAGTGNALATDLIYAVVLNETTGAIGFAGGSDTRADQTITIPMNEPVTTGDVLHAYVAFRRADGRLVSPTSYLSDTVS